MERQQNRGQSAGPQDAATESPNTNKPESRGSSDGDNGTSGTSLLFPEIVPWPMPIEAKPLLDQVSETICRFVIMDAVQADALTLWVAHTHLFEEAQISPIAIINAPEKECAKTLLQDVLSRFISRPLMVANITESALFRVVEKHSPTLFIDEADTFFKSHSDMHGMVNAGYRRGGSVYRTEKAGESFEVRAFNVFSPKSIAGIALERHLPDATMSRGVVINLRRKLPEEKVERLRHAEPSLFYELASKLARFAQDYVEQVRRARPEMPDALSDRAQDNWEILFAIAECAGPEWLERARIAALALSGKKLAPMNTGNELLADIQEVFQAKGVSKISSADLIDELEKIEEGPWATYNHGKPITQRQLSKQLAPYGVHSKTVRKGPYTPKGYEQAQFEDAFARYLSHPEKEPQPRNDAQEAMQDMDADVAEETPQIRNKTDMAQLNAEGFKPVPTEVIEMRNESPVRNADATPEATLDMESCDVADEEPPSALFDKNKLWEQVTKLPPVTPMAGDDWAD